MSLQFLRACGYKIAYDFRPPKASHENAPIIVYLGGLMSSMQGTKASLLDKWAAETGVGYLRFDYRGHGQSSGDFVGYGPDHWAEDAILIVNRLVKNKAILVGSSLGGWIGACVAKVIAHKIAGFIGVASAPDFVERDFVPKLDKAGLEALAQGELVELPSDYPEPYRFGKALIDGGKRASVLNERLPMPFPVRLLHGLEDHVVDPKLAIEFSQHIEGSDVQALMVKGEDHGFSSENGMRILIENIENLLKNSL